MNIRTDEGYRIKNKFGKCVLQTGVSISVHVLSLSVPPPVEVSET
jgi:hypothetical protein